MSRMRDRPPVYDTRHNYQARNGSAEGNRPLGGGADNPAMEIEPRESVSSSAIYINSPPPPYMRHDSEDPSISVVQAPPPYSVAIKTECPGMGGGGEERTGSQQQQQPQSQSNYKELYI